MTIGVCCLLALLAAGPGGEVMGAKVGVLDPARSDPLISNQVALADVNQVCIGLLSPATDAPSFEDLPARVAETLKAKGIECVECGTGVTPCLRIQIETVSVTDSGHAVFRVQTALSRIVALPGQRSWRVQADVWRLNPAMKAVVDSELADAVAEAVAMQAEVFAVACQAARGSRTRSANVDRTAAPGAKAALREGVDPAGRNATPGLFVASRSSSVFHRPNCRWARNIAEQNRVTYKTRTEAIQAGKRPCKSCKP